MKRRRIPQIASDSRLTTYVLPNLSEFVDPNIGVEPVVAGPPKVIGGVVGSLTNGRSSEKGGFLTRPLFPLTIAMPDGRLLKSQRALERCSHFQ